MIKGLSLCHTDLGFFGPAAEQGVGRAGEAREGDNFRVLWENGRPQVAQEPEAHAVDAEVAGPCLVMIFQAGLSKYPPTQPCSPR